MGFAIVFISVAVLMLAMTLKRGWHPYPLVGRAYRGGANPGLYWLAVIVEIVLIFAGVALYFST